MADAKLVIEIEDDKGGGPAPSALAPPMSPAGTVPTGPASSSSRPAGGSAWDSLPEWKPAGTLPAKPEPMPGEAAVREGAKNRDAEQEEQKSPRQPAGKAAIEIDAGREALDRSLAERRAEREAMADRRREDERRNREAKAGEKEWQRTTFAKRRFDDASGLADRAGSGAVALAGNNAGAALNGAVGAATAGLSRLGPYGMAAGAALQTVAAVGNAASDAVMAFVNRGKELSGYNAQLAGASAEADVRSLMADMREAEQLGPQMAELIETQSKMEASFRELILPIKEWILDVLNAFLKSMLEMGVGVLEGINEMIPTKVDALEKAIKKIHDILEGKDIAVASVDELFKQADAFIAPKLPAGAIRPLDAGPALGIPFLGGL